MAATPDIFVLDANCMKNVYKFWRDKEYGGVLLRFASNTYDYFCICSCGHNNRQNEDVCPNCGKPLKKFDGVTRKTRDHCFTRIWRYIPTAIGGSLSVSGFNIVSRKSGSVYTIETKIEDTVFAEMWMDGSELKMDFRKSRYGTNGGSADVFCQAIRDWSADERFEFVPQVQKVLQYVEIRKRANSYSLMGSIDERMESCVACANISPNLLTYEVMKDNLPILESLIKAGASKPYSSVEEVYKTWKIHPGMWPYVGIFFSEHVLKDSDGIALRNGLTNGTVSNGAFLLQAHRRGIVSYENIMNVLTERKQVKERYGKDYLPLYDNFISKNIHKVSSFNAWTHRTMDFLERVEFLRKQGILPTEETLDDRCFYPTYNKVRMSFKAAIKDVDQWEKDFMKDPLEVMGLVNYR